MMLDVMMIEMVIVMIVMDDDNAIIDDLQD